MNNNCYLPPFKESRPKRSSLRYLTVLLFILAGVFLVCTSSSVRGQSSEPAFYAIVNEDNIPSYGWPLEATVTLTIDDPDTSTSPDYSDSQTAVEAPHDPNETEVVFYLSEFTMQAGQIVQLTDGVTTKTTTITSLVVTAVDEVNDTVSGTADPGTFVRIDVCDDQQCVGRDEIVDTNGDWLADFATPGDESWEQDTYDLGPGSSGNAHQTDEDGDETQFNFHVPNPTFAVRPNGDNVNGWDWAPNAQVTITFNDLNNGSYEAAAMTDGSGYFDIYVGDQFDFGPGAYVEVTDGVTLKDHTVTYLEIYDVDIDTEMVYGTAEAGAQVQVWVCDAVNCAHRWETVDVNGNWMADFSVAGDEGGEEQTVDIMPGTWVDSGEWDQDGDNTNAGYSIPNPRITVSHWNDWINGDGWPIGANVQVDIDDPATPSNPDYSFDETVDSHGEFFHWLSFDIQPGFVASVTDGETSKTLTVSNIEVTLVDADTDTVTGVAGPDAQIGFWVHGPEGIYHDLTADSTGNWSVNLSGEFDLVPGTNGSAKEFDADGDMTHTDWQVPNPQFVVQRENNQIDGWQWQPNTAVSISIDGVEAATTQTNEWGDFGIHLGNQDAFAAGMEFVVTDGVSTKSHTVTDLAITAVDPDADTVSGTAVAGSEIDVWIHEPDSPGLQVIADGSGSWTADFSGQWDLLPGTDGAAQQNDNDGDGTWIHWRVPNPTFSVRLFDGQVEGWEWPLGANVTMTIDDPATPETSDYTDTQTVITADWDPSQSHVRFDFNYVYFIQPGHIVTLSDGTTTKIHTVVNLGITEVNENADTVSGTADANAQVDLWICEDWGCVNRHVTADSSGNWLADFANPGPQDDEQSTYDIVPGTRGDVAQSDDDSDSTQIWWDVSNPRLEVSYEHDWVNITGFSPDGQVTYTIYDYEGGHALFGPVTGPVDPHGNGWISQNLFHTDLIPGMYVEAVDETTGEVASLTISEVNLDYIGAGDDRAFGTAVPNSTIELHISETRNQGFNLPVEVDGSGYWEVDLAAAGYAINGYRHADVRLYDAEGDSVIAQPPRVHAHVRSDHMNVDNFSKNADVTLTLYDSPGGSILYGPETLRTDGSGNAWVNLWELSLDLQVGQTISAYDHNLDFTKTLTIEPFTFEEMDTAVDTVRGTAAEGEWVDLHVESLFSNWGMEAQADAAGQWTADYSLEGYDLTDQMWAYGWAVDEQSNWSEDYITGLPNIEASTSGDWISGFNFSPNRQVHIEIYDQDSTPLFAFDTTADGNTQFHADYGQHGIDLQPGMFILATDTETGKSAGLTLVHLTFDGVDYDAETAWGRADAGATVVVRANSFFEGYETAVTADASGNWFADFSQFGADLTPDWNLRAYLYDAEMDANVADAPRPPHFTAGIDGDWINGNNWTSNSTVQISVYDNEDNLILDAFGWETDPQGNFHTNLWEQQVDLQPGNYVVVHDVASGQEKTLTLADLSIESVDYDQDTVGGMAPPDTRLTVGFGGENNYLEFDLFSEPDGTWLADFATHDFDLQPDMWGHARITDEDGDATQVDVHASQHTIWARPHEENVEAVGWPLDAILTLTIDNDDDPDNGVLFTADALVGPFPFPGPETLAVFQFDGEFDLQPGHIVRVTDGQFGKEVLITPLAITDIDIDADIIYGVADPFSAIYFHWGPVYEVAADENGDWVFDLSGIADLDYGTSAFVFQEDEDRDRIEHHFEIESPPFLCEPGDSISGYVYEGDGVTPIFEATVYFDDFATGEPLYYTTTDNSGAYGCALPAGDYRVRANSYSYSTEYYEETIYEHATKITVTADSHVTAVNFTLDTPFFVWEHLTFNLEDPVTGDLAVRQAIAFGADRAAMIAATFPTSPILDSYLPPDHWAYAGDGLMQYDYDPDLARMILEQAGWVDVDGDGVRERDGQRLQILYVTNLAEHRQFIIEIFVANMADIGVEVEVWADPNPWNRILQEHDFSVAQFAWGNDANGEFAGDVPWHIFACGEFLNAGSYCNPTADQMLDLLRLYGTRAEILPFLVQHQQTVIADLAVLPLMLRMPEEPSPLSTFVALGQEGVYLKQGGTVVSGDVGANTAVAGPHLSDDAEVVIGTHVTFLDPNSRLMGDSIRVKQGAEVYDVSYNSLSGNGDVLGTHHSPLELPLIPALPDAPTAVPGTQDLDVAKNEQLVLDAGSYGLLEASKGATIIFTGGVYDFAEWDIGQDVNLLFEAPGEVRVAGRLLVAKGGYVGPAPGAEGLGAADIVFYVLGVNGNDGNPNAAPKAAVFGLDNTLMANIYVPNGTLHIRQGSDATGAFLGRWVLIGNKVTLTLAGGW